MLNSFNMVFLFLIKFYIYNFTNDSNGKYGSNYVLQWFHSEYVLPHRFNKYE